jgi:hypothetical protein
MLIFKVKAVLKNSVDLYTLLLGAESTGKFNRAKVKNREGNLGFLLLWRFTLI